MPPILLTIDEQYAYDSNGNRLSTTGARQSALGSHNRLQTDGTYNYVYDNEGNIIRRTQISDGSVLEYQWDHRNRLTKISTMAAGATVSSRDIFYYYDAFDRRVGKTIDYEGNGVIDRSWVYVFDGQNTVMVLQDADGAGSMQGYRISERILQGPAVDMVMSEETYLGGAGPLVGSSIASSNSGTTLWTIGDDQGSIQDTVDNNGVVRRRVSYNAFGQRTSQIDTDANGQILPSGSPSALDTLFGYTGRDWDSDAQLQNNRARWYDPTTARWLSQDPIGFAAGDANLYRMTGNHPNMATDPSGLVDPRVISSSQLEELKEIHPMLAGESEADYRRAMNVVVRIPISPWLESAMRDRAMGGISCAAHGNGKPAGYYGPGPSITRPLTSGELSLLKSIFGTHLNTEGLVLGKTGLAPWVTENTMTPRYTPWFPSGNYSDDYSAETGWKKRHFIHEMTHVLQSQNGNYNWMDGPYFAGRFLGEYGHAYPYSYDDLGKKLCSFNFEQQADIVADYFTGRIPEKYREKARQTIEDFDTQGNKPLRPGARGQTGTGGPFSPR